MASHIEERQAQTQLNDDEIDELHQRLYLAIRDGRPDVAHICAQNILKI